MILKRSNIGSILRCKQYYKIATANIMEDESTSLNINQGAGIDMDINSGDDQKNKGMHFMKYAIAHILLGS